MSKPTIGRVVTIHSNKSNLFNGTVYDTSKPFAAIVTGVHDSGMIAVTVFPPGKDSFPIYEVPSVEGKEDGVAYWEWPVIDKEETANTNDSSKSTVVVDRPPSDDEQLEAPVKKKPAAKAKIKKE
jgi:hypothetical protein